MVIRLSGKVVKRKKKLSKKYYGTSHVMSKDEAKFVFDKGCEQLIAGESGLNLSPPCPPTPRRGWGRHYYSDSRSAQTRLRPQIVS